MTITAALPLLPRVWFCLGISLGLVACTQPPDLRPVEAAFAPGTAGMGADRIKTGLSNTDFGRRVAAAVRTAPALANADAGLREARAEEMGAGGAFLPTVSFGAEASAASISGTRTSGVSPYVRVSQLVYDGGAARSGEAAARARVYQAQGSRLQEASAAALTAVETWQAVLTRRKLLGLAQENLAVHRDFGAQIGAVADAGAGMQSDFLTAKARLADAETRVIDARAALDRAEARFVEIFGTSPGGLNAAPRAPALPGQAQTVISQSPRMRAILARSAAAEAEVAAAEARKLPRVEMGATGLRAPSGGTDTTFDLSVNYALDTGRRRAAATEAAKARLDAIDAERQGLEREISRALDFVRSDQKAGAERVKAARAAARANAETVAAARDEFTVGRRSLLDLLDAQRDYVNAEATLIRAEDEYFLTDYAALSLTGDILDVFGVTLALETAQ
jgi:outer membrane protein, adhesin transport system